MMDLALNAWMLFRNAARHHRQVEIVSRRDGVSERITYIDFASRTQQLMHALAGQPVTYDAPHIAESTPLGLCYTSGTTGRPKGVV